MTSTVFAVRKDGYLFYIVIPCDNEAHREGQERREEKNNKKKRRKVQVIKLVCHLGPD